MKSESRRNVANRFLEDVVIPVAIRNFNPIVHFDVLSAIVKSGGYPILLPQTSFDSSISPVDFAHTLSNHHQLIVLSGFNPDDIDILSQNTSASIMCAASSECNPIPVLSQYMCMIETGKTDESFCVSYIGHEEPTLRSWVSLATILGFKLKIDAHHLSDKTLAMVADARKNNSSVDIVLTETMHDLISGSNYIVIGDTRHPSFTHNKTLWHIDEELMKDAKEDAIIIYSLPTLLNKFVDAKLISRGKYPLVDASVNQEYLVRSLFIRLHN